MKRFLILTTLSFMTAALSCQPQPSTTREATKQDSLKPSNEYTCPMHPDIITGTPGDCPKCGMELHIKS